MIEWLPYLIVLSGILTWVGYALSDCRKSKRTDAGDYGAYATLVLIIVWWVVS